MHISDSKETLFRSCAFKITYYFSYALFSLFSGLNIRLLFSDKPRKMSVLIMGALFFTAFFLVARKLEKKNSKYSMTFFALSASFVCTYGFSQYVKADRSLLWLLLFFLCAFLFSNLLQRRNSRAVHTAAIILGSIFALFSFVGVQLEENDSLKMLYIFDDVYEVLLMLIQLAGTQMIFTTILSLAFSWGLEYVGWEEPSGEIKKNPVIVVSILTVLFLVLWLPYYYAFYPGSLTYDSLGEIRQQMGLTQLSNHHPIIHQLLIGLSLKLSCGVPQNGVGIYSAIQMSLLALSFSTVVFFMSRMGVNRHILIAAFCFYAFFPINPIFSITMWKDVLFGAICLLLMLLMIHEVKTEDKPGKSILSGAAMVAVGFLFCVFRNNGWYAFLLGFPIYIYIYSRSGSQSWKRLCLVFIAVILLVSGYNHIIFDRLGIKKSASGEALSIPLQQIARTIKLNPEVLYSEEAVVLKEVYPEIEILGEKYNPRISDPIKAPDVFKSEIFDENPSKYMKAWAKLGLQFPITYIEAFLLQNYGYWYPDTTRWIVNFDGYDESLGISQLQEREQMQQQIRLWFQQISEYRPTAILYSLGLMVWLMIIAAAILILKGQGKIASPMFILAGLWLTTLASPVYCEYRYMYGFVVCVPLFLGLALGMKNKNKAEQ